MFFKLCDMYAKFLDRVIILLGVVLMVAVGIQIAGRYIWFIPLWLWPQEFVNFALIWSIFIGSVVCLRDNKHFFVDIFQIGGKGVNPTLHKLLRILHYLIVTCMTVIFIYYGWLYFKDWGMIQTSDITGINLGWLYISVPFAGASWLLFIIEGIIKEFFLGVAPLDHPGRS